MQFIETAELKPGMRLAKPIYSKNGVMLYDRDTKLTSKGIVSIKNFNLIGIYILEPAEPLPPLSKEDLDFEQFQTIVMFQIQDIMQGLLKSEPAAELNHLVQNIIHKYGAMNHKLNFTQPLRSATDYVYKHANSVAILTAIISHIMNISYPDQIRFVSAALLYDIGYLFLDTDNIVSKKQQMTKFEADMQQKCRLRGLEVLSLQKNTDLFPEGTLDLITQVIRYSNKRPPENVTLLTGTKIIKVADTYDRMTAMSLEGPPVSEIAALRYLINNPDDYDRSTINALISSIQLLPAGCCVDLSTKEKGLVIQDNPSDFMQPLILKFSNNRIYDLSDPKISKNLQISDIMKTMDNRIKIDEETLKRFKADKHISEMADKYKRQKEAQAAAHKTDLSLSGIPDGSVITRSLNTVSHVLTDEKTNESSQKTVVKKLPRKKLI